MTVSKLIIIVLLATVAGCCNQATKKQAKNAEKQDETTIENVDAVFPFDTTEQCRTIKYFFQANGGATVFFGDRTAYICSRCELDAYDNAKLEHLKPNATYEEFPTYLVTNGNNRWELYDDFGRIEINWLIINYHKIESPYQITNIQIDSDKISPDSIQTINETCWISVMPETKEFEDENSEEAENYFTAMDDWAYYDHEICERFKKIGIKNVVAKKKYLSFVLNFNEKIIVDTKAKQSFGNISALLYKKGHIPMLIDITDSEMENVKNYLKK